MTKMRTFPFSKIFNLQTGKVDMLTGQDSIRACLTMLISSCKGELLGDPDYGTDIKDYLINYEESVLYTLIQEAIVDAVRKYEKRVTIEYNDIRFRRSTEDDNLLYITISYLNKTNGRREDLDITLNSEEMTK